MTRALDVQDGLVVKEGVIQRAEHAGTHQMQQIAFAGCECVDGRSLPGHGHSGNQRVMVCHLAVVNHLLGMHSRLEAIGKRQCAANPCRQLAEARLHVVRQVAAVGARIGQHLLFIQPLRILHRLLGRISKELVGVALKRRQVIQRGSVFASLLMLDAGDNRRIVVAGIRQPTRVVQISIAFRLCDHAASGIQLDRIEALRLEIADRRFARGEHGQRRSHHAPNMQRGAVQQRVQARRIHADEPVGLRPAERRPIQIVVVRHRLHAAKAVPDCAFFHRRNPQPAHRLLAACLFIDEAENQLALASCIGGADDSGHALIVHERLEDAELLLRCFGYVVLPLCRENRQILVAPAHILGVIGFGQRQLNQVSDAPADERVPAAQIPVCAFSYVQDGGNRPRDACLFGNDQFHMVSSMYKPCGV